MQIVESIKSALGLGRESTVAARERAERTVSAAQASAVAALGTRNAAAKALEEAEAEFAATGGEPSWKAVKAAKDRAERAEVLHRQAEREVAAAREALRAAREADDAAIFDELRKHCSDEGVYGALAPIIAQRAALLRALKASEAKVQEVADRSREAWQAAWEAFGGNEHSNEEHSAAFQARASAVGARLRPAHDYMRRVEHQAELLVKKETAAVDPDQVLAEVAAA